MKKIILELLLTMLCFNITGCKNIENNDKTYYAKNIEDLKSTKTIKIKYRNEEEILSTITNQEDIDKILELFSQGKKLDEGEMVAYIAANYEMKLLDKDNNIIEIIDIFRTTKRIELNKIGESYYIDTNTLLELVGI